MLETRGYLELVVDVAEKQLSQPSEECIPKVIVRLAEKALCISKRWNKLQRKVNYWGSILSMFSKPWQTLPKFELVSGILSFFFFSFLVSLQLKIFIYFAGISRDDFLECITATPDTLIHPYLIEFEICLRDMWYHFLSRTHFWARIHSDPVAFTLNYWSLCWRNVVHWLDFFFVQSRIVHLSLFFIRYLILPSHL